MSVEKISNLETEVSINWDSSAVIIKRRISIPLIESRVDYRPVHGAKIILDSFSDVIIAALEARCNACMDMLMRNIDNVIHNDGQQIIFKKNNGSIHIFNVPSYNTMKDAIGLIELDHYEYISKHQWDQIAKSLYWIEKPADRNGFSFGNLISFVMEMFIRTEA